MPAKILDGRTTLRALAASMLVLAGAAHARAQTTGSVAADRARVIEITEGRDAARRERPDSGWHLTRLKTTVLLVEPAIRVVNNSAIPYSLNDGALWAGRGLSGSIQGGVRAHRAIRGVTLRGSFEPVGYYSQNRPFLVFRNFIPGRSAYANPYHAGPPSSIDLPLRHGDRPLLGFDWGNTGVAASWKGVELGATTAAEWWGPAIRNALIMSTNAPGIPRFFLRTAHPVRTRAGSIDARLFSGTLTHSRFFSDTAAQYRSIGGLLIEWRPVFDSMLTVGLARVVYDRIEHGKSPVITAALRSLGALSHWEPMSATQQVDQISGIFARWIFGHGFEAYGEWARMEAPQRVSDLLITPHHSGAWTFGFQWAQQRRAASYLRLHSEFSYLEQSNVLGDLTRLSDFYSGRATDHGYTQRGQIIGAAIGPGGSSQFLALDWLAPRWQIGPFVGRVRWENDALYRQPEQTFFHHDVSLLSGVRGGWRARFADFSAELTVAGRYNYLFQNASVSPPGGRTVDVQNVTLSLSATPR